MVKESSTTFFLPSKKYFKTRGAIERRKTLWTGDTNLVKPGQIPEHTRLL